MTEIVKLSKREELTSNDFFINEWISKINDKEKRDYFHLIKKQFYFKEFSKKDTEFYYKIETESYLFFNNAEYLKFMYLLKINKNKNIHIGKTVYAHEIYLEIDFYDQNNIRYEFLNYECLQKKNSSVCDHKKTKINHINYKNIFKHFKDNKFNIDEDEFYTFILARISGEEEAFIF
jgi:hypothetical protein